MTTTTSSLGKKVFSNTVFAIADLILAKIGTTAVFVLLVRTLSSSDIAAVGIGMGYLVIVAYIDVSPIRVLLRDYPTVARDQVERDRLLTALFVFWVLQTCVILPISFGINVLVLKRLEVPGLTFLFFGMTIDFIALTFQDWLKLVFYTDFQQALATKIGFFFASARLACYGLLILSPSLANYTWILIFTALANCLLWGILFQRRFHYRPIFYREIPAVIWRSLAGYGLWDHLNRMAIDTLFTIDTVVLSWFGALREISNYTIALKFTSLLFLIPMQVHRSLQVMLSNLSDGKKQTVAVSTFLKINTIFSGAQMLVVLVAGGWLIHLLFGIDTDREVIEYTLIIAAGVTIMNLGWPLISVINNYCSLRDAFLRVFLPSLVAGLGIYIVTAMKWGAIGVAYGNIAIYSILVAGLVRFSMKRLPFEIEWRLITREEKKVLRGLLKELFRDRG